MASRTFIYTGKSSAFVEHKNVNHQLRHGEKFTTNDESLAEVLTLVPGVKEEGKDDKPSRRSNAA